MKDIITVDFETEGIQSRPEYPPQPVGLAIRDEQGHSQYFSWGHPENNNCSEMQGQAALARYWQNENCELLFHNAAFDYAVATEKWGFKELPWHRLHDTMFQLYLYDPHAADLALKSSSERIMSLPPEERDELQEWIETNVPGITKRKNPWGANICKAPGDLVGRYAIGDVDRTFALAEHLSPTISRMQEAYDRERELMPILLDIERVGLRVDRESLEADLRIYQMAWDSLEEKLRAVLGDINLNSSDQLGQALLINDIVDSLPTTSSGKFSVTAEVLEQQIKPEHAGLLVLLRYRGALKTCLNTFLGPWLEHSSSDGRLHTRWHQVRNPEGRGTRTGRIASSGPNLTNVPNEFSVPVPQGFPPLPRMRKYLLPEEGHRWLKRDYSSQEIRVAAHFEDGELMRRFQEDPNFDPHAMAAEKIQTESGLDVDRGTAKAVAFSLIYGTGITGLSTRLQVTPAVAAQIKDAYLDAVPGVRQLMTDVKSKGSRGESVRTTGGRDIRAEPPKDGRSFAYKLLNHLIQGSSADITKQAMIDYAKNADTGLLRVQVYDEINISAPVESAESEMEILRETMESVPLDVKLLSEGYMGDNWLEADK